MSRRERVAAWLAGSLARLLLPLYPRGFRREAGPSLTEDFRRRGAERVRDGGPVGFGLWLARGAGSLLATALAEWGDLARDRRATGEARARGGAPRSPAERVRDGFVGVRLAIRGLLRSPGFTLVMLGTLALGIGGTAAVFSVVRGVLVEPLPYPEAERLVRLYQYDVDDPDARLYVSAPHFLHYREHARSFQSLAALYTYAERGGDLTAGEVPERVRVLPVSADYFRVLGREPYRGRAFTREEETGAPLVILSEGLWRRLGAGQLGLGSTIDLDGEPRTLVGVVASDLEDPVVGRVDVWIPQDLHGGGAQHAGNHFLTVLARLAPGVAPERARQEMRALDAALLEAYPEVDNDGGFRLVTLHEDLVAEARPTLLLLLGAVGLVLLIACVNAANLQAVRTLGRERELALRSALGASRGRIARQLLGESLLLALAGGCAGLLVGGLGVEALLALGREAVPRAGELGLDGVSVAFTAALGVWVGLGVGLAPALRLVRGSAAATLREGSGGASSGRRHARLRAGLVAGQVGLALMLLAGASVLAASLYRLTRVELGIRPEAVLTFELNLPPARYDGPARATFHDALTERLARLSGVGGVGATSWLPATGRGYGWGTRPLSGPRVGEERVLLQTDQRIVAGDFFSALGIPLLEGRVFDERDHGDAPPVAVVSRSVAEELFPGASPLGQRLRMGGVERDIVGVVGEVAVDPDGGTVPHVYHPHAQYADRNWALTYLVKARADPQEVLGAVRAEVAAVDPQLVLHRPRPLEEVVGAGRARERFAFILTATFAALALSLAVLGLYGVLAWVVGQRRREIGIRIALGAPAGHVAGLVAWHALAVVGIGLVLGGAGSLALGRLLSSLLFRTRPADPLLLAAAAAVLALAAAAAAAVPAVRALRVQPRTALEGE